MIVGGSISTRLLTGASVLVAKGSLAAWTQLALLSRGGFGRHGGCALAMASSSSSSCSFSVVQFPCLNDNYGFLLHHDATGQTAAIDVPDASRYQQELTKRGWQLTHIFNTHHHGDHTGGNLALKETGGDRVVIYGPHSERIPGRDIALQGGDEVTFAGAKAKILDVGGHTKGHIAYHFAEDKTVFVGDSLFVLGCGRMFEGTPEQFWTSLQRLRALPDETTVYCAHEYTLANARFAQSVEPGNAELATRVTTFEAARSRGLPTVPSLLGDEKRTNPFLRCDMSVEIRSNVGASANDSDAVVFGKLRKAKDVFR